MEAPDQQFEPKEWNLFVGSSKLSFISVLLHDGNELLSIQIAHFHFLHPVAYHVTNVYFGAVNTTHIKMFNIRVILLSSCCMLRSTNVIIRQFL
jgi:hypothetical protein